MATTDAADGGARIITFYSYKGGTGRTMALANVAWILASNGHRVLVVDWDLESPGLHRYFSPFLLDPDLRTSDGVIELIRRYSDEVTSTTGRRPAETDWLGSLAQVEEYAVSLRWNFPGTGTLDLVPAGRQDRSYSEVVSKFDWDAFWNRLNGGVFIDALRADMRRHYDFVLIDSRTGLSDTAGICTVQLPDAIVNCFTLNNQSVKGAAAITNSIREQRGSEPITVFPVLTRIEGGELKKLARGREHAYRSFDPFADSLPSVDLERYWADVEVPHVTYYAYEEVLAPFFDPPHQANTLLASYVRLAQWVTGVPCSAPVIPDAVKQQILQKFERPARDDQARVLISYAPLDRIYAEWLVEQLVLAGYDADWHCLRHGAPSLEGKDRLVMLLSSDYFRFPDAEVLWRRAKARLAADPEFLTAIRIDGSTRSAPFTDHPWLDIRNSKPDRAKEQVFSSLGLANYVTRDGESGQIRFPVLTVPHWSVNLIRNRRFSGRSELTEQLRDALTTSGAGGRLALVGMHGVGKTQLALEYVYRFAAAYDIVWWISAEEPARLRTALADLGAQLGLAAGTSVDQQIAAAQEALRRGEPTRRSLIVVDNLEDPRELEALIPASTGHIIVTSRNSAWNQNKTIDVHEVGLFTRAESIALLTQRVEGLDPGDADKLADKLGDLPLALDQASGWLATTLMPVDDYLTELDRRAAFLLAEPGSGSSATLTAAVRMSVERLQAEKPAAARLLELFAFLAPEAIPWSMLKSDRLTSLLSDIDPKLRDPLLHGTLVKDFGRLSLARIDTGSGGTVIHRLTQQIIREDLTAEQRAACRAEILSILAAAAADKDSDDPKNWKGYDQLRSHMTVARALDSDDPDVRRLVHDVVRYLRSRGDAKASQDLAEQALAAWAERFPKEDQRTLMVRFQLANALREQGRHREAFHIDREVLELMEGADAFGPDDPYTLMVAGSYAADLRLRGEFEAALERDRTTVSRLREVLGDNHTRTLLATNNLGVSLRLNGRFGEAKRFDSDLIARASWVLGAQHRSTLNVSISYGRDLRETGDLRGSESHLRLVVDQCAAALGEDHTHTWRAKKALATTLRLLGQVDQAAIIVGEAIDMFEKIRGHDHPDTMICRLEQACAYSAQGQHRRALRMADEVEAYYRHEWDANHPFTLAAANDASIFQRRGGDLDGARRIAERVSETLEAVLGTANPYTVLARLNRANARWAAGATAEGAVDDLALIELTKATFGDRHFATLAARVNRAVGDGRPGADDARRTGLDELAKRAADLWGNESPVAVAARSGARVDVEIELHNP
jgi:tetratricopeptide (TPR) repeat protein